MFIIAEVLLLRGEKELISVPKGWVRSTKTGGSVLLWPNRANANDIERMKQDPDISPQASWSKFECVIRRECATAHDAELAIEAMFGKSERKRKASLPLEVDSMFDVNPSPPKSLMSQRSPPTLTAATLSSEHHSSACLCSESITQLKEYTEQKFAKMEKHFEAISKTLAKVLVQQKCIMETIQGNSHLHEVDSTFSFAQIDNEEQLDQMEAKLEWEDYKKRMIQWLNYNISGGSSYKRMFRCLDHLFTRNFQTKCSWTGVSRVGPPKTGILQRRNVVDLFVKVGTTNLEIVNEEKVARFFMQRFKNAKRSLQSKTRPRTLVQSNVEDTTTYVCRALPNEALNEIEFSFEDSVKYEPEDEYEQEEQEYKREEQEYEQEKQEYEDEGDFKWDSDH